MQLYIRMHVLLPELHETLLSHHQVVVVVRHVRHRLTHRCHQKQELNPKCTKNVQLSEWVSLSPKPTDSGVQIGDFQRINQVGEKKPWVWVYVVRSL